MGIGQPFEETIALDIANAGGAAMRSCLPFVQLPLLLVEASNAVTDSGLRLGILREEDSQLICCECHGVRLVEKGSGLASRFTTNLTLRPRGTDAREGGTT